MTYPLVSICIPTYNGAQFIAEAMDSAVVQTYPSLEIIVSDDASTDGTLQIIETYKTRTSIPIHIYHHEPNGIGANWNYCIKKARGDYIKFLFQDDVLLPKCIEEMVNVLDKDQSISLVACKRKFIVEPSFLNVETKSWIKTFGDLQSNLHLLERNGVQILSKHLFKMDAFFNSPLNKIGEPTAVLFRRDLVNKIGFFREDIKQIMDFEFWYRILKTRHIAVLNKKLIKFRLHHLQTSNKNRNNDINDYIIYNKIIYKEYFWFINSKMKFQLLKKYNPLMKFLIRIKKKIIVYLQL